MSTLLVPEGKQATSIAEADSRINVWVGAFRSGKTVAANIKWLDFCARGAPGPLLMVGKTERTLKRNILDPIAEILPKAGFRHNRGEGEAWIFGRKTYIAGANDERAEQKIRGLTLAAAYGDEVTTWPESFYKMMISRLSLPGAQAFLTTNPDSPRHWFKLDVLDRIRAGQIDGKAWDFRLEDNRSLAPEYVKSIKQELTGLWYARYIEGKWVAAEGVVYDNIDLDKHKVSKLPKMVSYWLGIDYGTTNPFVILLLGEGVDGTIYVVDEWRWDSHIRRRQKTDAEYSADTQAFLEAHELVGEQGAVYDRIHVDRSAASFILQLWNDGVYGVAGADNRVLDGIRAVHTLFGKINSATGQPRLMIHERAEGLLDELQAYSWDTKAQMLGVDKPLKVADHGPDALRYAIMGAQNIWRTWVRLRDEAEPDYRARERY